MDLLAPYIVAESSDVMMFSSLESLTGYLEHYDVRDGVYVAWDSSGRTMQLSVGPKDEILVTPGELSAGTREALYSVLAGFVGRLRADRPDFGLPSPAGLSLAELVAAARPVAAYPVEKPRRPRWYRRRTRTTAPTRSPGDGE